MSQLSLMFLLFTNRNMFVERCTIRKSDVYDGIIETIDTDELERSKPEKNWIFILRTWVVDFDCINRNFNNRLRILNNRKYFVKGQSASLLNVFLNKTSF